MPATKHRITLAATALGVAGTIAALSSPLASAGWVGPDVEDCSSGTCTVPTSFVVGQSYRFQAFYDGQTMNPPVTSFYDNGACIGSSRTYVTWVPLTTGTHTMSTRVAAGNPNSFTVVVVAAPPGAQIAPQPTQGGCGGGGSFGFGSSDLLPGS